jgi:hypothetical protein
MSSADRAPSPLENMETMPWVGCQEGYEYEAALEAINGAVGAYSALIAELEAQEPFL